MAKDLPPLRPTDEATGDDASPRKRNKPKLLLTNSMVETALSPGETWTPAPGRVCVVLDFDLTLAQIHVYKALRKLGFGAHPGMLGAEKIFGDAQRFEMIQKFLERLRGRRAYIAVLTNNSEEVVQECLQLAELQKLVDMVISVNPSSTKGRDFSRLRPPGVTRWVFADDDSRNIRSVERETRRRVPCIKVDGGQGLQQHHIDTIEAAAFPPQFTSSRLSDCDVGHTSSRSLIAAKTNSEKDSDDRPGSGPCSPEPGLGPRCRQTSPPQALPLPATKVSSVLDEEVKEGVSDSDGDEHGTDEVVGPMMRVLSFIQTGSPEQDLRLDRGDEPEEEAWNMVESDGETASQRAKTSTSNT